MQRYNPVAGLGDVLYSDIFWLYGILNSNWATIDFSITIVQLLIHFRPLSYIIVVNYWFGSEGYDWRLGPKSPL